MRTLLSAADCNRLNIAVDVYLLVDCSTNTSIRNDMWDMAVYIASSLYPNSITAGLRFWLVSTTGERGVRDILFNPLQFASNSELGVLNYINNLRNCNSNSRSTLSATLNYMGNIISEIGRDFIVGVVTDRTNAELESDRDLPEAIQPYSTRRLYPFFYYMGATMPAISTTLQRITIYRTAYPMEAYVREITSEICSVLPSAVTGVPTPPSTVPTVPTATTGRLPVLSVMWQHFCSVYPFVFNV